MLVFVTPDNSTSHSGSTGARTTHTSKANHVSSHSALDIKTALDSYNVEKEVDRKASILRDFELVQGVDSRINRNSKFIESSRFKFLAALPSSNAKAEILSCVTICCCRCFTLFLFKKGATTTSVERHQGDCYRKEIDEESAASVRKNSTISSSIQPTLFSAFAASRQDNLNNKLMKFIVAKHLPFNIVKSSEFLEVIQSVDNKLGLPSLEKLRKSIDEEVLAFSTKNAKILQDDTFFNVDFDLWDGGKFDLLCLNIFCINSDFEMKYFLLDVSKFEGSHSGKPLINNCLRFYYYYYY
jgi:hypothetical protein